jgi:hypothetical protein
MFRGGICSVVAIAAATVTLAGCGGRVVDATVTPEAPTTQPSSTSTVAPSSTSLPESTTTSTTRASTPPAAGLIKYGLAEIAVAGFDGTEVTIPGDRFFPDVWRAYADTTGGIVYALLNQHPSWPEGTIFRLAPDTVAPEAAFVPNAPTRTELYEVIFYQGEPHILLGQQSVGVTDSTTLLAAPLRGGEPIELATMPGLVDQVSFGGTMFVAAVPTSMSCSALDFFDHNGEPIDPPGAVGLVKGCNETYVSKPYLAQDGSLLIYQVAEDIVLRSVATGVSWQIPGFLVAYDGQATLAVIASGPEGEDPALVTIDTTGFGGRTPIEDPGWASFYSGEIDIPPGATLDLGRPEVECSAREAVFSPVQVDLPPAVEATRDAIVGAATSCDFAGLAALAEPIEQFAFYTSCCGIRGGMEDDPERFWLIGEVDSTGEMAMLVRILEMEPARQGDGWVWPSAAVQSEAEIDWPALDDLYQGMYRHLFEISRDRGYYNGFRVEITDEGRWAMFQQIIDPPYAG